MAGKAQNFTQRQHMLRPGYEIFRYCDSELGEVSLHHHDFYEIYLFLNGSVEYSIESRIYRLLPGDILLIGPMELHQPRIAKDHGPYERRRVRVRRPRPMAAMWWRGRACCSFWPG